jgi:hypothetical protein
VFLKIYQNALVKYIFGRVVGTMCMITQCILAYYDILEELRLTEQSKVYSHSTDPALG